MTNLLHSALSLFLVRNVDSILGDLSKTIARLEQAIEKHCDLNLKHAMKANYHDERAEMALAEADRAERIVKRLKALVD